MKKFFRRIVNIIKFVIKYFKYQSTQRKVIKQEKDLISQINPETLSSRSKDRIRQNKQKIKKGQMNHRAAMIMTFRKKKHQAMKSKTKVYLGKKNKQGIREILNGKKDKANEVELILDHNQIRTQRSERQILKELQII